VLLYLKFRQILLTWRRWRCPLKINVFKSLLTTVTKSIQSQVQYLGLPMKGDKVDLNLAVKDLMSSSIQVDIKQMVSAQF
jgi:hypothetical protein